MRSTTFAIGPTLGEPVALNPLHPLMHGGFRIHCELEDEVITGARVEIGHVHRGAEKLFEVRDYRAGAMLANRHIWTSPTAGEYAFVLAAEELLALRVSPRAEQLRVVFAEVDRILSHLAFLAPVLLASGVSQARERLADLMAVVTGSRMHHHIIRIGGVAADFEDVHRKELDQCLDLVRSELEQLRASREIEALVGVGIISPATIDSYGVTGPIARASGVARDERVAGYGAYSQFTPVVREEGDAAARVALLVDEVEQSIRLIGTAIETQSAGELLVRTPKNLRLPEGESHGSVEGGLGVQGVWLFSEGGLAPARVRLRTASFANLHALEAVLIGVPVTTLALVLSSWLALSGDADR